MSITEKDITSEEEVNNDQGGKKLSKLLIDCVKEIKLKNGMVLQLSTLDAKHLGMWNCPEKKHRKCNCRKLKKYGKVELISECYIQPTSRAKVFS